MKWNTTKTFLTLIILVGIGLLFNHFWRNPELINGEIAQNFTSTMPDGTEFELYDLKGSYILLDFWGSWCGPCRRENPKLVALYDAYHGKEYQDAEDFEIVSVGLETNRERWIRAIQQDDLKWPWHVSSLERMSAPEAKLYNVREIPTKFLINPTGKIVAVNPATDDIASMLRSKLETN